MEKTHDQGAAINDQGAAINGHGNLSGEDNDSERDKAVVKEYFKWNHLHLAAAYGDGEVFQKPLNPNLCETLDSHRRSPLHLASSNGDAIIVKALIEACPKMCFAHDQDGLNPVHAAAMAGKVEVLDELLKANPCAARSRADNRERYTILHLCVKYNQPKALKKLLKNHFKGTEFVNAKDLEGNTILHLAVANRSDEIIGHLLKKTEIDVNATNANKQTAMDILHLSQSKGKAPQDGLDLELEDLLHEYDGRREKDLKHVEWFEERRNLLTVVAILMATIAFQAGMTPPGGAWQDNVDGVDGHRAGEAVMAYNHPHAYINYIYCNTIGFVASLITIIVLVSGLPLKRRLHVAMLVGVMCVSITSMAFTYAYAILVFTPKHERKPLSHTIIASVSVWCGVLILLLIHGSRFIPKLFDQKLSKWIRSAAARICRFGLWITGASATTGPSANNIEANNGHEANSHRSSG